MLSAARIAGNTAVLMVLAVACAGGGAWLLTDDLQRGAKQHHAASSARLAAARVEALVGQYRDAAQRLAARSAEKDLLAAARLAERSALATELTSTLPHVRGIRWLAVGERPTDLDPPVLTYACLDLVDRSEKGGKVPGAELHLANNPSAHIDVLAPILDPGDRARALGHVILSIDPGMARSALAAISAEDGYVELRQTNREGQSVTVAGGGDPARNVGEPLLTHPVSGTDWRVAYWPAPAAWQPSPLTVGLLAGSAALAVLLLVLAVTLPERMLKRALMHDAELLGTFFDDIRSGVLMDRYPFRLKEIAALARRLRKSGEGMIADRRALEHRAQSDALTGLASHAAFDMRLEQLHHQAHTGFPSALLLAEIDHIEQINTQIGPEAGDILLKQFAQQLRLALRQSDMVARLEGGRFGVLFPLTDLAKVEPVVQRLREKMSAEFDPGSGLPRAYAWSAGLTVIANADAGPAAALARAEAGLQAARDAGGNRTVTHMPSG